MREERVCGDAAITHWCSSPKDPRVLSPHRLLGAAILLARPLSEAGLPFVTSGSLWFLKARLLGVYRDPTEELSLSSQTLQI